MPAWWPHSGTGYTNTPTWSDATTTSTGTTTAWPLRLFMREGTGGSTVWWSDYQHPITTTAATTTGFSNMAVYQQMIMNDVAQQQMIAAQQQLATQQQARNPYFDHGIDPRPPVERISRPAVIISDADKRAEGLLLEHLTPEQKRTFKENKWFVVRGGKSGKQYRIRNNGSLIANIEAIDDKMRLCAHAMPGSVPHCDQLLAQKLYLESDEEAFLRIANRH